MTSVVGSENQMAPYRRSADEALSVFNTNAQLGLSNEEAVARRGRYGRNELAAKELVPGMAEGFSLSSRMSSSSCCSPLR